MKKLAEHRKETLTKVVAKLNDEQQKTWKEMLGAPFEYTPTPFRRPQQLSGFRRRLSFPSPVGEGKVEGLAEMGGGATHPDGRRLNSPALMASRIHRRRDTLMTVSIPKPRIHTDAGFVAAWVSHSRVGATHRKHYRAGLHPLYICAVALLRNHSTVTLLARFRGLSISRPSRSAT